MSIIPSISSTNNVFQSAAALRTTAIIQPTTTVQSTAAEIPTPADVPTETAQRVATTQPTFIAQTAAIAQQVMMTQSMRDVQNVLTAQLLMPLSEAIPRIENLDQNADYPEAIHTLSSLPAVSIVDDSAEQPSPKGKDEFSEQGITQELKNDVQSNNGKSEVNSLGHYIDLQL